MLSAGLNTSSYLTEESGWRLGYRLGLTFNIKISKAVFITLPFAYTRIYALQKNVEGKYYSRDYVDESYQDYYVYKLFRDWQISVGLLEIPILLSYKFYNTKWYNISCTFGPGIVIAIKDFSKQASYTFTDEIIGTHDGAVFDSVDPVDPYPYFENSGFNLNTGLRFNVSRFYFDIVYTLYPFEIKEIKKLNTISLILSVDLEWWKGDITYNNMLNLNVGACALLSSTGVY